MSSAGMIVESDSAESACSKAASSSTPRRGRIERSQLVADREQHLVETAAEEVEIDVAQRVDDVLHRAADGRQRCRAR